MAKILLIEDDPLVVRMYQKVLAFEGFEIASAANGREGLIKAKEMMPDLIFLDVMMPKMNGLEVLDHLKADIQLRNIPVIMLTNLSGTHDAETAIQKGAFAYMVKSEYKPKDVAAKAKDFFSGIMAKSATVNAQGAAAVSSPVQQSPVSTSQAPVSQDPQQQQVQTPVSSQPPQQTQATASQTPVKSA